MRRGPQKVGRCDQHQRQGTGNDPGGLTGHETGSEAFGKGKLRIGGAAAPHVDADFQNGVKFLTMAIDRFRNEKAHTADGNITDPLRAYEYLRLSSLAMHLLDKAEIH